MFASLVRKYPSKHFPKIGNVKSFFLDGCSYQIYLMEKLEPLTCTINGGRLAFMLEYLEAATDSYIMTNIISRWPDIGMLRDLLAKQPGLVKAMKVILDHNMGARCIDLHAANIMQRANGTVVIIDPYSR